MIILDKKKDIAILKAMGSSATMIRQIFMRLGLLYTFSGIVLGVLLALILYMVQKQFGIITIPQGFVIDTYPIQMRWSDIIVVSLTVVLIGTMASLPAALRAGRLSDTIRNE
jgi:lipoprotein-releasing system permease protein